MGSRIARFVVVAVVAVAFAVVSAPAVASAADVAAECLACHGEGGSAFSRADFAGSVDYGRCASCHWIAPADKVGGIYRHSHSVGTGLTCQQCHGVPFEAIDPSRMAAVATPLGYFATSQSASSSAAAVHAAHARGSWPQASGIVVNDACRSCHAPVACGACHVTAARHADHTLDALTGAYGAEPVSGRVAVGTAVAAAYADTSFVASQTCVAATCHAVAPDGCVAVPTCGSCHPDRVSEHGYDEAQHTSSWSMAPCAGAGCHPSGALMEVHVAAAPGFVCSGCHASVDPAVRAAITAGDTACGSCHPGVDAATGHRPGHAAAPPLFEPDGSGNYAYLTGTVSGTPTADCALCHSSNLVDEHLGVAGGTPGRFDASGAPLGCASCHASVSPNVIAAIAARTTACDSCHVVHDRIDAEHVSAFTEPADPTCASCHAGGLEGIHASATTTTASGALLAGCALCHRLTDGPVGARVQDAIERTVDTRCAACHDTMHGDIAAAHTAGVSEACVACHESSDVITVHAARGCAVCHDNPARVPDVAATTPECVSCHADRSPADTAHHDPAVHTAVETGCRSCHAADLAAEHAKPSSGPVSCVTCHETRVDALTTAWDGSCATCHPTRHGGAAVAHVSPSTACAGAGCHATTDVSDIHKGVPGGGCAVCHGSTPSVTCQDCHAVSSGGHHASHESTSAAAAGCGGCHFTYLDDEHAALGIGCSRCHASTVPSVTAAIGAGARSCTACHPAVNGRDRHISANATEFAGGTSGHRSGAMPGMRSSFTVAGTTYTWPLPTTSFLKSGWTTTSMVRCDACHTPVSSSGPHGAAVTVTIDPAYSASYRTAYLTGSSGSGISSSAVLCAKCHTGLTSVNRVHGTGDHHGSADGRCVLCHPQRPHGWRLPRMLAYTSDPAPYASTGLVAIKLRSHSSANDWSESDCRSSCGEHGSSISPVWPSAPAAAPAAPANLSLGRTFTASRYASSANAPSKAGDDSTATWWFSGATSYATQSDQLTVDLGTSRPVSRCEVVWSGSLYAKEFRVYASTDNRSWTQVYSTTTGTAGTSTVVFSSRTARYVRVECRRVSGTTNGYGIAELRVFQ